MNNLPIVPLAKAIAQALATKAAGGTPFGQPVQTVFSMLPVVDPSELRTARLTVVPKAREGELASRAGLDQHLHIDIGIQKKLSSPTTDAELVALMALVDEVDDFVRGTELTGVGGLTWVGSTNIPIYAPEHLQKGVFTSVLTLTYRGIA